MSARRVASLAETTPSPGRLKAWAPVHCILCPRKRGLIANDRCLELQATDRCWCPAAATESVRAKLPALEEAERLRRHLLAVGRRGAADLAPQPPRILLGLHGKKGHGKTTLAEHLVCRHSFVRLRFAAPLKEVIGAQVFGMTEAQTDGWLKESLCVDLDGLSPGSLAWRTTELLPLEGSALDSVELVRRWRGIYWRLFSSRRRLYSPREILQVVGGGARERIGERIWIDLLLERLQAMPPGEAARLVIDDVRFPDEKDALESLGGQVWRLVRTDLPASRDRDRTETACDHLPDVAFAAVLRRSGSREDFLARADQLLATRVALPGCQDSSSQQGAP